MKINKNVLIAFTSGAVLFGTVGVLAGQYTATDNPFPVQLNGENVSLQSYNIDGSTYFKLRDIADVVGGFDVDFWDYSIELSKDGYVYDHSTIDYSKYIGEWTGTGHKLNIYSIDGNNVKMDMWKFSGKNTSYVFNTMEFTDLTTLVVQGEYLAYPYENYEPVALIFKFESDHITVSSEGVSDIVFYKD